MALSVRPGSSTRKSRVRAFAWLPITLAACACSGNSPPPQSPEASQPAEAAPPPSTVAVSPAGAAGEEKWEGEDEATRPAAPGPGGDAETRTNEVIAKVIRDNRKPFRDCFEKAAKEAPGIEGTMTLHFVLNPEGKVKSAELNRERSTMSAPSAVDCSIAVLKGMKFPPSSRGMESVVNYPFDFKR